MFVLIHVIIALSSLACTTYAAIAPSKKLLRASYSLVALTLVTGVYLVVSTHAQILSACTTGLVYLAIVSSGLLTARYRLAA